ncbi:MAG: glycosyltransferase family 4 protein [Actinomycetota bacterium]
MTPRTITFVAPRYGADVFGGAEQAARSYATRLAADGWSVRVLTTCARSIDWDDEVEPGTTVEEGVEVTRHRVRRPRDPDLDRSSARLFAQPEIGLAEAEDWIDRQGPDSPDLLDAIAAVDEGVVAVTPYLYQPTVRGAAAARVPVVLHGAAHREAPLRLPVFDRLYGSVDALAHFSQAEQRLALDRFPATATTPQVVLGMPIDVDAPVDPAAARAALGLGDEPFVVCLGRVDAGKGVHDLVERFRRFREQRGSGRLVLAGPVVDAPPATPGVTVLGPVPTEHKFGLLAAADVLINPSPHESFSIVVPEALLAGTPVLVNGWCLPLREHVVNSHGGLWYTGLADFDVALGRLLDDTELRDEAVRAGADYVRSMFSWDAVRTRYERLLAGIA